MGINLFPDFRNRDLFSPQPSYWKPPESLPNLTDAHLLPAMQLIKILPLVGLLAIPAHAAVSIVITPGPTAGTTIFTLTQTSPPLTLPVAGIVGYASGMAIPTSMFNLPGFDSGIYTDIFGNLSNSLATVTETISGQSFQLDHLRVSADPSLPSLLGFNSLFVIPNFATSVRFEAASTGPVSTTISYAALFPGVHSVEDTLFGTVTVTVVPEPSACLLFAPTWLPLLFHRRRFPQTTVRTNV